MLTKLASSQENNIVFKFKEQLGIGIAIISLFIFLSFASPYFFQLTNIMNILLQITIISTMALGMTYVIIAGGIDLSVGSLVALTGVVLGLSLKAGLGVPLSIILCLLSGLALGLLNGIIITKFRVTAFIATLGMMSVARGLALYITGGVSVYMFPKSFLEFSSGSIGVVPLPVIYTLLLFILGAFIINKTKFGRYVYAIGGNKEAVRLSGITVWKVETWVYAISGLMCAVGAIFLTGKLNSAQPIAGVGYELDVIAAVIIGGTSLSGGQGRISGTLMGAILMGMLRNGLNLMNVSSFLQQIIIGLVIIGAVCYDQMSKKRKMNSISE